MSYPPSEPLPAPAGTSPNTVWIWLLALAPLVSIWSAWTIDVEALVDQALNGVQIAEDGTVTGSPVPPGSADPTGLLLWLGGIAVAFLDRRELARRGIDRPFSWMWAILWSLVYVIGRSIIVKRRTGTGFAPMWTAIALQVLLVALVASVVARIVDATIANVPL